MINESTLTRPQYQVVIDGLDRKEAKRLIKMIWVAQHSGESTATVTNIRSIGREWSLSETKAKEEGEE